jgi:DNA-binding Xre family transcriptional regulator
MARKFEELREGMSPDRRARNEAVALLLSAAMDLAELREAKEITQESLAAKLEIAQSNVSRLERRTDMLVSTLSEVVRAMGGELQLIAAFPDGAVRIKQFEVHGKAA